MLQPNHGQWSSDRYEMGRETPLPVPQTMYIDDTWLFTASELAIVEILHRIEDTNMLAYRDLDVHEKYLIDIKAM